MKNNFIYKIKHNILFLTVFTLVVVRKKEVGIDSSLVSDENFSEILWSSGWALGQVTWAKMLLHLRRHSQKISNPQPKKYFSSAD